MSEPKIYPPKKNELTYKERGHFKRILIFPTTIFSRDMLIFVGFTWVYCSKNHSRDPDGVFFPFLARPASIKCKRHHTILKITVELMTLQLKLRHFKIIMILPRKVLKIKLFFPYLFFINILLSTLICDEAFWILSSHIISSVVTTTKDPDRL